MHKFVYIVILFTLSSCYSDLNLDDHISENRIVVSTFIANDSLIKLNLMETFPVNNPSEKKYVNNASIYLYENDNRTEKLKLFKVTKI